MEEEEEGEGVGPDGDVGLAEAVVGGRRGLVRVLDGGSGWACEGKSIPKRGVGAVEFQGFAGEEEEYPDAGGGGARSVSRVVFLLGWVEEVCIDVPGALYRRVSAEYYVVDEDVHDAGERGEGWMVFWSAFMLLMWMAWAPLGWSVAYGQ